MIAQYEMLLAHGRKYMNTIKHFVVAFIEAIVESRRAKARRYLTGGY